MVHKGQSELTQILEKKNANDKSREELLLNRNKQLQAEIDKLTEDIPKVKNFYVKQDIPQMPDQTEALSKNFEETQGYKSLYDALTQKNDSITSQL